MNQNADIQNEGIQDEQQLVLLTVKRAAHVCSVSERTVYNLMKWDDLPFIMIGTMRRIPAKALDVWVETRTKIAS